MLPLPSLPDPDLLTDPFGWLAGSLIHAIFGQAGDPRAGLDSLLATFFCVGQSANPFRLENMCRRCADAYAQLRGLGIFALSVAVMARMVILALRYRREGSSPVHFRADIGVRLGLGIGALQVTFWLLSWLAEQSMAVASGVMQLLSKVLLGWGNQGLEHIASNVVGQIAQSTVGGGGNSQLSISLCILLLTAYVGYLVIMVVVSRAAIIFTILAAPLAVPALVFSEDSHVGGLWLRMLLFAAAVPMVAVLCLTLTILLLVASIESNLFPGVLPLISLLAGIWLSVRIINGLLRSTAGNAAASIGGTLQAVGLGAPAAQVARGVAATGANLHSAVQTGVQLVAQKWLERGEERRAEPPEPGHYPKFDAFVAHNQPGLANGSPDRALRSHLWAQFLARPAGVSLPNQGQTA